MAGRAVSLRNQVLADQVLAALTVRGPLTTREVAESLGSVDRWVEHMCFDGMEHRHQGYYRSELLACEPTGRFTFTTRHGTVPIAAHLIRRPCYPHDVYPTLARLERSGRVAKATTAVFRTLLWSVVAPDADPADELERLWALS